MNRIINAVKKQRCTFILSTELSQTAEAQKLSRFHPTISLGENEGFLPLAKESFSASAVNSGIIVMLEPNIFDPKFAAFAKMYGKLQNGPLLFFIGKTFNRFGLPVQLQFKNIQHIKTRGIDIVSQFAKEVAQKDPPKKDVPKKKAPIPIFIGREKPLEVIHDWFQNSDRALFLHGSSGIGKHWLVEESFSKLETPPKRMPEIHFGMDVGLDTLLSLIAIAAPPKNALMKALNSKKNRPNPSKIAEIVIEVLNLDAMSNVLFTFSGIEKLLDERDQSFYKERALEMVLHKILQSSIKAKVIMISNQALQTYNTENQAVFLEILGLAEDVWPSFFANWHFTEENLALALKFSPRTQGHPMAMRSLAVSIQSGLSEELLEQSKRGIIDDITDPAGARKLIQKLFNKLSNELKDIVCQIALFGQPVPVQWLQTMIGMKRAQRIELMTAGMIERTPVGKLYYIHPLVESLRLKGVPFEKMEHIGLSLLDEAKMERNKNKNMVAELHLIQTANRILYNARQPKKCWRTSISCVDHLLGALRRVTFRQKKYDVAERMLQNVLRQSPKQPDALLIEHFLLRKKSGSKAPGLEEIHNSAGTPETYHYEATLYIERGQLDRATKALEKGSAVFSNNARLRRRLSGLYLRQSKIEAAEKTLLEASLIQPLMPDTYAFLGDVYTRMGSSHWEKAEKCFDKANQIGGETPPLLVRNARFLRFKAINDPENSANHYEACEQKLSKALELEPKNLGANISMATVLLDRNGDLEQIEKHLKPFAKFKDHTDSFIQKARLLARKKDSVGAHNNLNKAYKLSSDNHYAFYVRGEIFFADGDLSNALEAFKNALNRCPSTGAERTMYTQSIARMEAFIQTQSQIENEQPTETELIEASGMGFRRDPGMIIRRKSDDDNKEDESPSSAESSPLEETATNPEITPDEASEITTDEANHPPENDTQNS